MPRSARIELRADPEREERIRRAASLLHQSVSSFVLDAAAERADTVLAEAARTVVPAEFFDELWSALEAAPRPNAALERRAGKRRRVSQG